MRTSAPTFNPICRDRSAPGQPWRITAALPSPTAADSSASRQRWNPAHQMADAQRPTSFSAAHDAGRLKPRTRTGCNPACRQKCRARRGCRRSSSTSSRKGIPAGSWRLTAGSRDPGSIAAWDKLPAARAIRAPGAGILPGQHLRRVFVQLRTVHAHPDTLHPLRLPDCQIFFEISGTLHHRAGDGPMNVDLAVWIFSRSHAIISGRLAAWVVVLREAHRLKPQPGSAAVPSIPSEWE